MRTRRGVSLIELLTVMSGCAIVLSTSAALVHRAMRAQSETRYFFDGERGALRLAQQFRRDVHRAAAATIDADAFASGVFLKLELPGVGAVEYRRDDASVVRASLAEGGAASREAFATPAASELTVDEADDPPRLVLTIVAASPRPPAETPDRGARPPGIRDVPVSLRVEAVISRDLDAAGAAAGEEDSP
jgi:hypothetical protein